MVGTPHQTFNLLFDTGSSVSAFLTKNNFSRFFVRLKFMKARWFTYLHIVVMDSFDLM